MATPKFKQKCAICKKQWVEMFSRRQFPICVDCHMKQIDRPVKEEKFRKLFNIPERFYRESYFLRNIKQTYLRFENLTEKQIKAFKKTVKELRKS